MLWRVLFNAATNSAARCFGSEKTVITPALYKHNPYHFNVHCARGYPVGLDALERAGISFMPIGRAPENDRGPRDFGGERFLKRQGINDWQDRRWNRSWGIQIYTGIPLGTRWGTLARPAFYIPGGLRCAGYGSCVY